MHQMWNRIHAMDYNIWERGRWLTDITPYLFMLEQDDIRTFKYQGANKGQMTVKLLFSNWGEGERSFAGQQVFTGGEFNGQYNNETPIQTTT